MSESPDYVRINVRQPAVFVRSGISPGINFHLRDIAAYETRAFDIFLASCRNTGSLVPQSTISLMLPRNRLVSGCKNVSHFTGR